MAILLPDSKWVVFSCLARSRAKNNNIHDSVNNISALIHFLVLIAGSLFEVFICHHLNYHRWKSYPFNEFLNFIWLEISLCLWYLKIEFLLFSLCFGFYPARDSSAWECKIIFCHLTCIFFFLPSLRPCSTWSWERSEGGQVLQVQVQQGQCLFTEYQNYTFFLMLRSAQGHLRLAAKAHGDGSCMCSPHEKFCFWHASMLLSAPLPLLTRLWPVALPLLLNV
jgi:hypothetical protein